MKCPIEFKNEKERLQSGAEKNTTMSWLTKHHVKIAEVHHKITHRQNLLQDDVQLLDIVLNSMLCNIYHDWAETKYLTERSENEM